jgi:Domain of unknown function (DUF397)
MGNWRKSSYSDANGGNCVETGSDDGVILIRDTTDRGGLGSGTSILSVPAAAWSKFTATLR